MKDWATKIVALIISFGLWYGVAGRRTLTTQRLNGVQLILQFPSDTEANNEPFNRVDLTVTGDKNRLERLDVGNLIVVADLSQYKTGDLVVQLKPETVNVDLPYGVRLDAIEPNKISVKLEPRIEKYVDVKPVFTGSLPNGEEIYQTTVTPAQVRIRGAASRVNALNSVSTEKIELLDKTGDFTEKQATIDLLDPKITLLDPVVDVAVKVGERRVAKTLSGVVVRQPDNIKLKPETVVVVLFGAASLVNQLKPEDLQIEVEADADADSFAAGKVVLPEQLRDKIEVRSIQPNKFTTVK